MPGRVNKNREAAKTVGHKGSGRVAQRNRTRRAIVEATMRLLGTGKALSVTDIAEAAEVSRRTVYMYFPTLEQLLLDATIGALTQHTIDSSIAEWTSKDPVKRIEHLSRAMNSQSRETLELGRSLIRLTVEGDTPTSGVPKRGYRRVEWIERALEPARSRMSKREFERLVSAVCLLIGWEPLIVLKDIRSLDADETDEVLVFAVRAVVESALAQAEARRSRTAER